MHMKINMLHIQLINVPFVHDGASCAEFLISQRHRLRFVVAVRKTCFDKVLLWLQETYCWHTGAAEQTRFNSASPKPWTDSKSLVHMVLCFLVWQPLQGNEVVLCNNTAQKKGQTKPKYKLCDTLPLLQWGRVSDLNSAFQNCKFQSKI